MANMSSILSISCHAADYCSRSGGTLARYANAGSTVSVIDLTYGEKGESAGCWQKNPDMDLTEVKSIRRGEAERSAQILGVADIRFNDWGDHPFLANEERLMVLVDQIREIKPDIVLTHWTPDRTYPDHSIAGEMVVHACLQVGAAGLKLDHPPTPCPQIYFFEATYPNSEFTAFNPTTFIDITDVYEQKMRALQELAVTQAFLPDFYSECAIKRGKQASRCLRGQTIKYSEGFVRLFPWAGGFFP